MEIFYKRANKLYYRDPSGDFCLIILAWEESSPDI